MSSFGELGATVVSRSSGPSETHQCLERANFQQLVSSFGESSGEDDDDSTVVCTLVDDGPSVTAGVRCGGGGGSGGHLQASRRAAGPRTAAAAFPPPPPQLHLLASLPSQSQPPLIAAPFGLNAHC